MCDMNEQQFGDSPIMWMGQIVDDKYWKDNIASEKWDDYKKLTGWGYRYKVRIFGKHSEDKSIVPDERLPWAEVLYPVTAGSGHGASYQSSNLKKGAYVYGFYKDGIEKTGPIIIGCLPNADQTELENKIPSTGFVPFSGFIGERVPVYSIPPGGSPDLPTSKNKKTEGGVAAPVCRNTADQQQQKDCTEKRALGVSSDCQPIPLSDIQKQFKKLIQDIENKKKEIHNWSSAIKAPITENGKQYSIEQYISEKINSVSKFISNGLKIGIKQIEQFILDQINNAAQKLYYLIPPGKDRSGLKGKVNTVLDLIGCLFRKIVSNLTKMIGQFLKQIVDRYINAPLCAIESFVSALLGKITGLITSAISAILAPLNAILGVLDIVGGTLGLIQNILSFLTCDDKPECPEVKGWSIWDGPETSQNVNNSTFNSIIDKAKEVAEKFVSSVDPNNFNFDLNFTDVVGTIYKVNTTFCGTPEVKFISKVGTGSTIPIGIGATAKATVSSTGEILKIEIIDGGSGYTVAPTISVIDRCGIGTGAVLTAIVGTGIGTINDKGKVIEVKINKPGTGYGIIKDIKIGESCNVGPILCGPPKVEFFGGSGSGAIGNAIVSASGKILGIDIVGGGFGYSSAPIINITDSCGRGKGAIAKAIVGVGSTNVPPIIGIGTTNNVGIGTTTKKVVSVVIEDPGSGYLPTEDGSSGGDGRTWAKNDDTIVQRADGTFDIPYPPGQVISLNIGDKVKFPCKNYVTIDTNKSITTPPMDCSPISSGEYPTLGSGKYPVVLTLCDTYIDNIGINYSPTDKIIIEPSNGAEAIPIFGAFGTLSEVKIISTGIGFTERPRIYIESETGYNANIIPVLCANRIGENEMRDPTYQDKIISVVDCVGKL